MTHRKAAKRTGGSKSRSSKNKKTPAMQEFFRDYIFCLVLQHIIHKMLCLVNRSVGIEELPGAVFLTN